MMRLPPLVFTLMASFVLGQDTPEWKALHARQAESRKRGTEALQRERERRKSNLCSKSTTGNVGIAVCLSDEFRATDANYLTYVRSIGALLRLTPPSEATLPARADAARLPFDEAESAWQSYRDKACAAMRVQWQGSQAGVAQKTCLLDLTWNHMDDLANLYNDLWH